MRPVAYWTLHVLRAQWRQMSVLGLIVAALTGPVLALAAGAERTSSAPDRYTATSGAVFQARVEQDGGRSRAAEVAGLPGVASVEAFTFVFGNLVKPGGQSAPDALVFAGSRAATGRRLVAGREPDPASRGEFVATRSFADRKGAEVGDRFDLQTLTQGQADKAGFESFGGEGPQGPSVEAVLVGVDEGANQLGEPSPIAVFPPSLLDGADVGVAATIMSVQLRPGTDLPALRAALDTLPTGDTLGLRPFELVSAELRTAVRVQGRALWLLTAVGAAAAVVVLGQLVSRSVRLSAEDTARLQAIGFRRGQVLTDASWRAALPIGVGTVLGAAGSIGLSPLFPTGSLRRLEPHPGVRVDPTVVATGASGLLLALLLWVVAVLILGRQARGADRPSALVESVATRCGSAAMSTGLRFAFARSQRSVRSAVTGMLVASALLVAGVVFGSSLGRLVTDGARFGRNFDLAFGSGGDALPDDLRARLESDADVAALMLYAAGQARVGETTIGLAGMDPVKGNLAPKILVGRLPAADDEIALGRLAAKALGTEVGADLAVQTEAQARRFRVTGLAVVPAIEGLDGVGKDAVLTVGGLARLDPTRPSVAAVSLRRGAPAGTAERLGLSPYDTPPVIVNLESVRSTPFLLAWLVGAAVVLTIVHVMVTSINDRRRSVAVLRALGAERRWITRTLHWQATMFSLVPLALGIPVGLIAGRLAFVVFADGIGAVPGPSYPFALLAALIVGLVALANAAATAPARRARRLAPASLLTGE